MANEADAKDLNPSQYPAWLEFTDNPDAATTVLPRSDFSFTANVALLANTATLADEATHALLADEAEAAAAGSTLATQINLLNTQLARTENMGASLGTSYTMANMTVGGAANVHLYGRKNGSTQVFSLVLPAAGTYVLFGYRQAVGSAAGLSSLTTQYEYVVIGQESIAGGTSLSLTSVTANYYIGIDLIIARIS